MRSGAEAPLFYSRFTPTADAKTAPLHLAHLFALQFPILMFSTRRHDETIRRRLPFPFPFNSLLLSAPQPALAQDAPGKQEIERVIETFRKAIIDKDQDTFLKLFLKEDITWAGVTTDASIERLYATRPDPKLPRPKKSFSSSPRKFIDMIVKDKVRMEETFSNVRIDSDGEVAQVWFDYSFMFGDYRENWGKESWQMVRTESGWKIAAVVWSQEMNPVPPPKAPAR